MDKLKKLKSILKEMGSVLIAYSAGADSTFLLKVARDCLGSKVLAVTADSPTYQKQELKFYKKMAKELGVRHKVIKTLELEDKNFIKNSASRCYFCKSELFSRLRKIAKDSRLNFVADASNVSDKKDFRPGSIAKNELGVRSPLQEAGFTKEDIRLFSKKLGLKTWDKPQLACLASRIPYGKKISPLVLRRINKAEEFLRKAGFKQVRLRHHDRLCRIEVGKSEISLLAQRSNLVVDSLKKMGYNYITLDLEGYRAGSMNPALHIRARYMNRRKSGVNE